MIKLNASFSKKVPGEQEYSSQGVMCSVELELSDAMEPEALNKKISETFDLVRSSVEAELAGRSQKRPSGRRDAPQNGRNGNGKATTRQVKFLLDLANDRGIELRQLNSHLTEQYGVTSVYDLTKRQCSEMLDEIKSTHRMRAA